MDKRIYTFTGKTIDPFDPDPNEIDVVDIAHALSFIPRFNGHTKKFISVAQHSLFVSSHCRPEEALIGLLHDASEAYINDIATPIKSQSEFAFYRTMEDRLMAAIFQRYGLQWEGVLPKSVREADAMSLAIEAHRYLNNPHKHEWIQSLPTYPESITYDNFTSTEAEDRFLTRFSDLHMNLPIKEQLGRL